MNLRERRLARRTKSLMTPWEWRERFSRPMGTAVSLGCRKTKFCANQWRTFSSSASLENLWPMLRSPLWVSSTKGFETDGRIDSSKRASSEACTKTISPRRTDLGYIREPGSSMWSARLLKESPLTNGLLEGLPFLKEYQPLKSSLSKRKGIFSSLIELVSWIRQARTSTADNNAGQHHGCARNLNSQNSISVVIPYSYAF